MRNRYVLLADVAMFFVAVCGAFGSRFDWDFFRDRPEFIPYAVAALVLKPLVFYGFGMFDGSGATPPSTTCWRS